MIDLFYGIKWNIYYFFRDIKFAWQRARNGHTESDVWNINFWFVENIIPLMEEWKENRMGHPSDMTDIEWSDTIDQMLDGFRLYKKFYIDLDGEPLPKEEWVKIKWINDPERFVTKRYMFNDEEQAKFDLALDLFKIHFHSLWD